MDRTKVFLELLNQHQNIIHKICNVYMPNVWEREDLFQEITIQAWKSYNSFKGQSKFSTWLYRVALNTAITYYRKEQKKVQTTATDALADFAIESSSVVEEQVAAMYKAIAHLEKIDKALVMLYLEDYSYIEIGEMLGITPNNVAVKMSRIKNKLKEESKSYYQHD
jgi:RNA polymerase sigma-70 factor, ECF subfamily